MPDVQNTLTFTPDGSLDIGASGASRPRDLYLGGNVSVAGTAGIGASPSTSQGLSMGHTNLAGTSPFEARLQPRFPSTATSSPKVAEFEFGTAAAAFTVSLGAAINIATPVIGAGSAVTTHRGILIANQGNAAIANAYGIYINAQSGATTLNIGLYNAGSTLLDGALTCNGAIALPNGSVTTPMIASGAVVQGLYRAGTSLTTTSSSYVDIPNSSGSITIAETSNVYVMLIVNSMSLAATSRWSVWWDMVPVSGTTYSAESLGMIGPGTESLTYFANVLANTYTVRGRVRSWDATSLGIEGCRLVVLNFRR